MKACPAHQAMRQLPAAIEHSSISRSVSWVYKSMTSAIFMLLVPAHMPENHARAIVGVWALCAVLILCINPLALHGQQ